jgi:hypothetical protein|tara:strand:+ start:1752 stop:1970 length:219 start_codon:yes stop_codon:yes gene_type:complete
MSEFRTFWLMMKDGDSGDQADPFEFAIMDFTSDVHTLRDFVVDAALAEIERRTGLKPEIDVSAIGGPDGKTH